MNMKKVYLLLSAIGLGLPLGQFVPGLQQNGLDLRLYFQQLFANHISGFFALDVMVSGVVLIVFVLVEIRRAGVKHGWAAIAGTLAAGVSFGLPLFLYLRERHWEQQRAAETRT